MHVSKAELKKAWDTLTDPQTYKIWDTKEEFRLCGVAVLELMFYIVACLLHHVGWWIWFEALGMFFPILLIQAIAYKKLHLVSIYLVYNLVAIVYSAVYFLGGIRTIAMMPKDLVEQMCKTGYVSNEAGVRVFFLFVTILAVTMTGFYCMVFHLVSEYKTYLLGNDVATSDSHKTHYSARKPNLHFIQC
ncbi:hypothetical protein DdX_02724 [Ditylenchus destructor]|uniref:Uncharacterized protein n=1 Tax=Ditylenchus destructor TaxID=166010 RepID=A0AAD4R6A7_9BILA|nr:hypothetical protein DdX_02724 [Ditylenchus destructor]